jgi:integrase
MTTNQSIGNPIPIALNLASPALPNSGATLTEVVLKFIKAKAPLGRLEYLRALQYVLQQRLSSLGHLPIGAVTHHQLRGVVFGRGLAPRTEQHHAAVVRMFFGWCRSEGYLPLGQPSPAAGLRAQVLPFQPLLLVPHEIEKLLAAAKDVELVLWLTLSSFAGLRTQELEQLEWECINPRQFITIPAHFSMCRHGRVIPIDPVLDAWLAPFYGSQGPVFSSHAIRRKVAHLARMPGIKLGRNAFRHSYCACRLALTNHPQKIAREVGHSPAILSRLFATQATLADAQKFFSISPAAVGIRDWPAMAATYLNHQNGSKNAGNKSPSAAHINHSR